MREIPIIYEDKFCIVFNKPAGLPVQGGEGIKLSLDSILSEKIRPRPFLVHRLDKETSGIILVAKTKEAARLFSALFANTGAINKLYLALCSGNVKPEQGLISLGLDIKQKGRFPVQKEAETFYRCLSTVEAAGYSFSLLELKLMTGRMHQIRRHLAHIGNPVLGDDKYGDFSLNKKLKTATGLKRLLLHAWRLVIPPLPELVPDGLDVTAPLPDYFPAFEEISKI